MLSLVVHTRDVVGRSMAGPAIRAFHFAEVLGESFQTTLIGDLRDFDAGAALPFTAIGEDQAEASRALERADVIIGQPSRRLMPFVRSGKRMVFDLFDPLLLELEHHYRGSRGFRSTAHKAVEKRRLRMALERGALLLTATRSQVHFYAGAALSEGVARDDLLDRFLVVPFGIEEESPAGKRDERLVVWGGGIWPWLDPMLAVQAITSLNARQIEARLLFLGTSRPGGSRQPEVAAEIARAAARAPQQIVVNEAWMPYRERGAAIAAARVAVMLHRRTLESEFAIRTRLFDAIWCGVPVVVSDGGFAADLVREEGIGLVVAPSSLPEVTSAIERLLTDDVFHRAAVQRMEQLRPRFHWRRVLRPLLERMTEWERETAARSR